MEFEKCGGCGWAFFKSMKRRNPANWVQDAHVLLCLDNPAGKALQLTPDSTSRLAH
jgi:hypothetical protein